MILPDHIPVQRSHLHCALDLGTNDWKLQAERLWLLPAIIHIQ